MQLDGSATSNRDRDDDHVFDSGCCRTARRDTLGELRSLLLRPEVERAKLLSSLGGGIAAQWAGLNSPLNLPAEAIMTFDPQEVVTLYNQGPMTLQAAVERVMRQSLKGFEATIFRDGDASILGLTEIEKLAADWGYEESD